MSRKAAWEIDSYKLIYGKKKTIKKKTIKKSPKKEGLKRKVYAADFNKLMDKQKGKCANKNCAKFHGVKQSVTTIKDIDHKIAIKLWELKKKEGDPNRLSNLQLLCTGCHRRKTAEDRKKIAEYKKKHGIKSSRSKSPEKKPSEKKITRKKKKKELWETLEFKPIKFKPPKF